MAQWRKAVSVHEFRRSYLYCYRNKEIAIFRLEDGIYATDNSCTHEYSSLSEGEIVDGNVYCPKHGSRFDIRTGKVLDFPATKSLKIYKTKIEDGFVYIYA